MRPDIMLDLISAEEEESSTPVLCLRRTLDRVALSCVGNDSRYIVELHSNLTIPVSVRFGYFGTCVSTTRSNNNENSNDQADGVNLAACISYSDFDEDEDPASQFLDQMRDDANGDDTSLPPADVLSALLAISSRLQEQVFPAAVPICFILIFLLSAFVFWILVPLSGRSKAYKTIFAATALMNSYGLILGFMAAYATRLACQGLILPSSGDTGELQPDV
ncbi:hypothetical protein DL768_008686 [Monosporascus sp. mg162]|nr:hypothetical protein DL768_008686 [Monosporascus sp. mg162]